MKNIHVLPTKQPSKLLKQNKGKLIISKEIVHSHISKHLGNINQNIYITSDEEIKNYDYCIDDIGELFKIDNLGYFKKFCKKIILTTDQELIKDGVQSITDDFLEWFVKNPTCKWIEYDKNYNRGNGKYYYKIIIPKEEPFIEYANTNDCTSMVYNPKQETLEEVKCIAGCKHFYGGEVRHHKDCFYYLESFSKLYDDLKQQQERSYSEEDLEKAYKDGGRNEYDFINKYHCKARISFDKWFEKFKKK